MTLLMPPEEESSFALENEDVDNAAIELAAKWNGPSCDQCSAPMKSDTVAICRRCGWYPLLGQFVEVDPEWESYGDDADEPAPKPAPSHAEVWLNLLPAWAWIMIATSVAVVVESVVARSVTADGSALRTNWSLTQLAIGLVAFLGCHFFNFLAAVADDADTGAFDFIARPLKLWFKAFSHLPTRLWVTNTAAAGLVAAVMSPLVIGGLPYERLWDWGIEQPAQNNLMGAVMSQVHKVEGDRADNMEDAVTGFAGQAGDLEGMEGKEGQTAPPPKPRLSADCVILGYRVSSASRLQSLVLGTAYQGKLVYAGSVMPRLSDAESTELLQMLADTQSPQAYLAVPIEAQWVVPKYSCQVTYESQQAKTGRLLDPKWEKLSGQLR